MKDLHKSLKSGILHNLMKIMDDEDSPRLISISVSKKPSLVASNDDPLKQGIEAIKKAGEPEVKGPHKNLESDDKEMLQDLLRRKGKKLEG